MKKNLKETVAQEIVITAKATESSLHTIQGFQASVLAQGITCSIDTIRAAVKELVEKNILQVVEQPQIKKGAVAYRIFSTPAAPAKARTKKDNGPKKVSKLAIIREAIQSGPKTIDELISISGHDRKNVHAAVATLTDPIKTKSPLAIQYDRETKTFSLK